MKKNVITKVETGIYLFLGIIMLLPFFYMLVTSLQETFSPYMISFKIRDYTLENYRILFNVSGFSKWIFNSLFISTVGAFFTICVCSLGAYGFCRRDFWGKNIIYFLLLGTLLIPFEATVVPLWIIMGKIGLIDSFWPLILPIPNMLGLLLIKDIIDKLPKELYESAIIDGCTDRKIFLSIVLPVIKPVLITVGILYFARSWNSFLWPLIISNTDHTRTITVGLASMQGNVNVNYGVTMAGSLISFLPPFIIYMAMQKYYISGLSGGIKY